MHSLRLERHGAGAHIWQARQGPQTWGPCGSPNSCRYATLATPSFTVLCPVTLRPLDPPRPPPRPPACLSELGEVQLGAAAELVPRLLLPLCTTHSDRQPHP